MRTRLDNILLGILWLLAATLGTNFWFNTKYGFNIFSAQHWQYLAYLQASQAPVTPSFYISLGICVFITIFGLYFLIQPKFRKIVLPIMKNKTQQTEHKPEPATHDIAPESPKTDASEIVPQATTIQPQTPPANSAAAVSSPHPMRPPRLTLPATNSYTSAPISSNTNNTTPATNNDNADNVALADIFTKNGYTVKTNPYIAGWRPNLFAIGANEVMWIGGVGVTTDQINKTISKLNQIFSDTLDGIYINITGFSINAPDAQTAEFNDVLLFNTIDDLGAYMALHPNATLSADEKENFDAYSEYIDTVINYIGRL